MPAVLFAVGGYADQLLAPTPSWCRCSSRKQCHNGDVPDQQHPVQTAVWSGEPSCRAVSSTKVGGHGRRREVQCFRASRWGSAGQGLSIVPELVPGRLTMADFTGFLREVLRAPRRGPGAEKKPQLLLIHQGPTGAS
ncbi:hypothetical protein ZWY2020_025849 [Hordeum vulgare]|nr:hypothetical protein ZWY2020_025849 [Hordeum vulgare]